MFYKNGVCRSFNNSTAISVIVCLIVMVITALAYSGTKLAMVQSSVAWTILLYIVITFFMWADYNVEFLPYLNSATVPIASIMIVLSGKGTWFATTHLWAGIVILMLVILISAMKMFREIRDGSELSAVISRYITCFSVLFGIPFSLAHFLK